MTISALQSGVAGINAGLNKLRRDADRIAQAGAHGSDGPQDMLDPLVNLKADQNQVAASAKVVETVHDLIGRLLDVSA